MQTSSAPTSLREGQVHRNTLWHAYLVQLEVRVPGNDCTSREVYTLSHKVTAQTTLFTLQTSTNGFDRAARLLQCLRNTGNIIIHVSGDMELLCVISSVDSRKLHILTCNSCSNSLIT